MAKKPISNGDLSWIIIEQLRDSGFGLVGVSVVPDRNKGDWRVLTEARSRGYLRPDGIRRLAEIEKKLRAIYALED